MNTPEDKPQDLATHGLEAVADRADKEKGGGEPGAVITLFFFVGFVASLVVGWVIFPKLLYSQQRQPIDFNHALHNEEVGEGCESCHFFREDGSFAGVPKLAQCAECHEEVQGESEDEKKFVEQYVAKGREVPWLVYSKQPDCVFFSHVSHVRMAKMDCVQCHGHIGESESLKPYEQNRITGYSRDIWGKNIAGLKRNSWDRMKMDDCAQCHESRPRKEDAVGGLPWPLSWMPLVWNYEGGNKSSVQTQKDACFVCHK